MYTLYTNSMSPYSFKALAGLGYAGVPCREEHQNAVTRFSVLKRLTGKTMVPVLRREDWAINDSTQILRWAIEESERRLLPEDPLLEPVCWLLEEFADEWVSRWVIFSRWNHEEDVEALSRAVGQELTGGLPVVSGPLGRVTSDAIKKKLERGGIRESNRPALEQSRDRLLQHLENAFEQTDGYLFGEAPTVADFALYGQLEQYRRDPTGGRRMQMYPAIGEWLDLIDDMRLPHPVVALRRDAGLHLEEFNGLFAEFFGSYWPVIVACHRARSQDGEGEVSVELPDGTTYETYPSGYVAGRVDFVVEQLAAICRDGAPLLSREAVRWGDAVDEALQDLTEYAAGRQVLANHDVLQTRVADR